MAAPSCTFVDLRHGGTTRQAAYAAMKAAMISSEVAMLTLAPKNILRQWCVTASVEFPAGCGDQRKRDGFAAA